MGDTASAQSKAKLDSGWDKAVITLKSLLAGGSAPARYLESDFWVGRKMLLYIMISIISTSGVTLPNDIGDIDERSSTA